MPSRALLAAHAPGWRRRKREVQGSQTSMVKVRVSWSAIKEKDPPKSSSDWALRESSHEPNFGLSYPRRVESSEALYDDFCVAPLVLALPAGSPSSTFTVGFLRHSDPPINNSPSSDFPRHGGGRFFACQDFRTTTFLPCTGVLYRKGRTGPYRIRRASPAIFFRAREEKQFLLRIDNPMGSLERGKIKALPVDCVDQ